MIWVNSLDRNKYFLLYFLLFFQFEHDTVKSKLSTLLKENQELRKELSKFQTCEKPSAEHDELIDCLKQQIKNLLSEKDDLSKLWVNANKTIELLEGELQIYQSGHVVPKAELLNVIFRFDLKNIFH